MTPAQHNHTHTHLRTCVFALTLPCALEHTLQENVAAVVLMHNELSSLQRQLVTSEATAAVAARRADAAEAAMQRLAAAAAGEWAAREAEAAQGEEEGEGGADSEARKAAAELKVLVSGGW